MERHLRGRPADVDRLLVGGNEPTLHPDFDRSMALAHELGFRRIELMTSGLQLARPERLAAWVGWGLDAVAVPIYAGRAGPHDAVCGTVCFDKLVDGLDAAHAAGGEALPAHARPAAHDRRARRAGGLRLEALAGAGGGGAAAREGGAVRL